MLVSGLRAWIIQRGSALLMIAFFIIIPIYMLKSGIGDFMSWKQTMATPFMVVAWSLFFMAIVAHAWVGIRDVILDYVHPLFLRSLSLSIVAAMLIGSMIWVLRVLLLNSGLDI